MSDGDARVLAVLGGAAALGFGAVEKANRKRRAGSSHPRGFARIESGATVGPGVGEMRRAVGERVARNSRR